MEEKNKKPKTLKEVMALAKSLKDNGDLNDSEMLGLLKNTSNDQIEKIRQVMHAVALKAESENITDSSDLLGKYIPLHYSYEIIVPYSHFPKELEHHEINEVIHKLTNDFGVLIRSRLESENISVRFPTYGNDAFIRLKQIIDKKCKHIKPTEKNKKSKKLKLTISKRNGLVIEDGGLAYSYPVKRQRFALFRLLKDGFKTGTLLADAQKRPLNTIVKEIREINRIFEKKFKKLKIKDEIIISLPTDGYELNHEKFNITFLD